MMSVQSMVVAANSDSGWSTDNKSAKRAFDGYLLNPAATKSQFYDYKDEGPLGIPSLTIDSVIDYTVLPGPVPGIGSDIRTREAVSHVVPQAISLASQACLFLDLELYKKLGAWGPECKIVKFLQMPQGTLVKLTALEQVLETITTVPASPAQIL